MIGWYVICLARSKMHVYNDWGLWLVDGGRVYDILLYDWWMVNKNGTSYTIWVLNWVVWCVYFIIDNLHAIIPIMFHLPLTDHPITVHQSYNTPSYHRPPSLSWSTNHCTHVFCFSAQDFIPNNSQLHNLNMTQFFRIFPHLMTSIFPVTSTSTYNITSL